MEENAERGTGKQDEREREREREGFVIKRWVRKERKIMFKIERAVVERCQQQREKDKEEQEEKAGTAGNEKKKKKKV